MKQKDLKKLLVKLINFQKKKQLNLKNLYLLMMEVQINPTQ